MPDLTPPMARPRVAAGLLIRNGQGQVLLVKPTYKSGWEIPGGYVEPGESPAQASLRELREELGIALPCGTLLVVDWAPADTEGDKLLFIFDAGVLPDDVEPVPDRDEIAEVRFWNPTEFGDLTPPRLARRLRVAVDAAMRGLPAYAEHGVEVRSS